MDDYAAQVLMHAKGLSGRAAPVLFTAHVIRAAKILRQSARRLGLVKDEERCGRDIERLSAALQCAWDGECGYFSYVLHDEEGRPQESAPHARQKLMVKLSHIPEKYDILRKKGGIE